MAPSNELAQEHTECLIFLLENLGFTVNRQKSLTDPTQEIDFLGLVADSVPRLMELRLAGSKIKNIRSDAKALLQMVQPTAREVSRLLGKLTHATHAMRAAPGPLLQTPPSMPASCLAASAGLLPALPSNKRGERGSELVGHSPNFMEREVHHSRQSRSNDRDGYLQHRLGCPVRQPADGRTVVSHRGENAHQLPGASGSNLAFAKKQENILVHLKMDSTSALTYINKMGGKVSPDLNRLTKDLWTWCLARNITLRAFHLPGALNEKADEEPRIMKDRSDWMLCRETFRRIQTQFGPLDIDLFASRLTKQLPTYVSWRPDPQALETDAFSMNWKGLVLVQLTN